MADQKPKSWVTMPRYILTDWRYGKITTPERNLLIWLRTNGDMYGTAIVDMESYANETFNKPVKKSYINKLLLSLKSKRYIWYRDRAGCRGSFEVEMGDWPLPGGSNKTLDKYFSEDLVRGSLPTDMPTESEVGPEVGNLSQRLQSENNEENKGSYFKPIGDVIRGYNNDKDKKKEKDNESIVSLSTNNRNLLINSFIPKTEEEEVCRNIARETGDKAVGYCLGTYKEHGLEILEKALEDFRHADGLSKDNPPAYFNFLVSNRINGNTGHQKEQCLVLT